MNGSGDDLLREAFDSLRRDHEASVPSFATLTSPAAMDSWRRRQRWRRGALLVSAIIIPTVIALRARPERGPDFDRFTALTGLDPGEVTWRAPTDFLLDLPGRELLRTIPLTDVIAPKVPGDSARSVDSNATPRRSSDS